MWKCIKGFENLYEVSDDGRIRSVERTICDSVGHTYVIKEKILKPNVIAKGYQCVYLRKDGKTLPRYVHRLVAEAFVPRTYPEQTVVNHMDGNKENNCASNLEWVTYKENNQHAYDKGLHGKGCDHYKSKLTYQQVCEIRKNKKYDTYEKIAERYNVAKATIRDVLLNHTYRDIIV